MSAMLRWISLMTILVLVESAMGRTIEGSAAWMDRVAILDERQPEESQAMLSRKEPPLEQTQITLNRQRCLLVRFDLSAIPAGQRVLHAELHVPVNAFDGPLPRLHVWRMIAEWGEGVNHDDRFQTPEPLSWMIGGGRGPGVDRGLFPSASVHVTKTGTYAFNVTGDVALWVSGVARQQGWMLGVSEAEGHVRLVMPSIGTHDVNDEWRLRITYEPK